MYISYTLHKKLGCVETSDDIEGGYFIANSCLCTENTNQDTGTIKSK